MTLRCSHFFSQWQIIFHSFIVQLHTHTYTFYSLIFSPSPAEITMGTEEIVVSSMVGQLYIDFILKNIFWSVISGCDGRTIFTIKESPYFKNIRKTNYSLDNNQPFPTQPHQHLWLFICFILCIDVLTGVRWYLGKWLIFFHQWQRMLNICLHIYWPPEFTLLKGGCLAYHTICQLEYI